MRPLLVSLSAFLWALLLSQGACRAEDAAAWGVPPGTQGLRFGEVAVEPFDVSEAVVSLMRWLSEKSVFGLDPITSALEVGPTNSGSQAEPGRSLVLCAKKMRLSLHPLLSRKNLSTSLTSFLLKPLVSATPSSICAAIGSLYSFSAFAALHSHWFLVSTPPWLKWPLTACADVCLLAAVHLPRSQCRRGQSPL